MQAKEKQFLVCILHCYYNIKCMGIMLLRLRRRRRRLRLLLQVYGKKLHDRQHKQWIKMVQGR